MRLLLVQLNSYSIPKLCNMLKKCLMLKAYQSYYNELVLNTTSVFYKTTVNHSSLLKVSYLNICPLQQNKNKYNPYY